MRPNVQIPNENTNNPHSDSLKTISGENHVLCETLVSETRSLCVNCLSVR